MSAPPRAQPNASNNPSLSGSVGQSSPVVRLVTSLLRFTLALLGGESNRGRGGRQLIPYALALPERLPGCS